MTATDRAAAMTVEEALTVAIEWARLGLPAFPAALSWNPGSGAIAKRPTPRHGHLDATLDPDELARLFLEARLRPGEELGVGVVPGPAGLVVLDCDVKGGKGGLDTLERLQALHGDFARYRYRTPSGGLNVVLAKPPGVTIGNHQPDDWAGVDVRADGGWIVAPGTRCTWGAWSEEYGELGDVVEIPAAMAAQLREAHAAKPSATTGEAHDWLLEHDGPTTPAARVAFGQQLDRLRASRNGSRHQTLLEVIGWIVGMVNLDQAEALLAVREEWDRLTAGEGREHEPIDVLQWVIPQEQAKRAREGTWEPEGIVPPSPTQAPPATVEEEVPPPTSWEPLDVLAAIRAGGPPPPAVLAHARGHHLLYAGRTHAFFGPSETLKSWAAQAAVAETLKQDLDVLYLDYEDDAAGVGARLIALGVPPTAIAEHLVYVRPDEALVDRHGRYTPGGLRFAELIDLRPWALAVLDGMTEAMSTEGLDLNDNADAAAFARRVLRPVADRGAAVVAIDHQPKNATETGRFAIGAQHKLAGLTGAAFRFENQRPLGRPNGSEPVTGLTKITLSKDRPGYLRGRAPEGVVGLLRVTAWPDDRIDAEVIDPADLGDQGADLALAGRILSHLDTYDGASKKQLEESVTGKTESIRATVVWLIGKGWVRVEKEGQAHRHYLTDAGREEVPK